MKAFSTISSVALNLIHPYLFNDFIQINSLHSTDSDIDVGILENLGIVEEDMPTAVVRQGNIMLSEQERQQKLKKQEEESLW